jgi:hypothetical protein
MIFPATAADFYAARDDRTDVYSGVEPQYTRARTLVTGEAAYLAAPTSWRAGAAMCRSMSRSLLFTSSSDAAGSYLAHSP